MNDINLTLTKDILERQALPNSEIGTSEKSNLPLCAHCSTSVRRVGDTFCCRGCEFVYKTIHSMGLADFYRFRIQGEEQNAEKITPSKSYEYLEELEVKEKIVEHHAQGISLVRFYLPTIHCAACVWLLEKLPQVVKGIKNSRVSFTSGQIEILYDATIISLSEIARVLHSVGYPPVPATHDEVAQQNVKEDREMLRRIGVAAVCAVNTMMLATSLFQSFFTGMEEPYLSLFKWVSALLALPAVTYAAVPFYRSAIGGILLGSLHIDLPISIAIVAAYIAGVVSTITHGHYIYFDSVTALIFLLLIARYIQRRAIHRARASTMTSWDLFPAMVRMIEDSKVIEKPLRELKVGEIVEVLAGERIAADGEVVTGQSSINSVFLTGEALPYEVSIGSLVLGGSINTESPIRIRVTEIGDKTRLGKIISALDRSHSEKTPLENEADKLSGYFIVGVLVLGIITYLSWFFIDQRRAFDATIALLIVTCPCALGLAIPAAVTVALSRAQKKNIFVKRAEALQTLAKTTHLYFDKTGTLTEGQLRVCSFIGDNDALSIAKTLSFAVSQHPVSGAIWNYCRDKESMPINSVRHAPARGIEGTLNSDLSVSLGSYKWFQERGIAIPSEINIQIEKWFQMGQSVSLVERDRKTIGAFNLEDSVPESAKQLIKKLQKKGLKISILSGDAQSVVTRVAKILAIPESQAHGNLYPEEKAIIIEKDSEVTAMIGDGLNDAQAMRASNVGIGLSGGIEATLESADIFIAERGLKKFEEVYFGAQRTGEIINRNLTFSLMYNIIGATAASFGYVTPLIAAILMPISSLTVILSSVSSRIFDSGDSA